MPPQALTTTYPTRLNTFNTALINQIIQPSSLSLTAGITPRTTKRGTQIINYAEDDDIDDYGELIDREPTRGALAAAAAASQLSFHSNSAIVSSHPHQTPSNILSTLLGYDLSTDGIQKRVDIPGKEVRRIPTGLAHRTEEQLYHASLLGEVLIPIRLDIDIDSNHRLKDSFLWNLNETLITPDQFAHTMCQDLDLSVNQFASQIATSIRTQIEEYAPVATIDLPPETEFRVIVKLEIHLRKFLYQDKFEWDIANTQLTPELFAKTVCADLGLHGEFIPAISTAIYESALGSKKQLCENGGLVVSGSVESGGLGTSVENDAAFGAEAGWRVDQEGLGARWEPRIEVLSREDMEKREGDRERQFRRLRRETTRFGGAYGDFGDEAMGRGERKRRKRNRSLSPTGGTPMQNGGGGSRSGVASGAGAVGPNSLADWERTNWRCDWCGVGGTSTWAVRDGPFGPKTLCNTCGNAFRQQGILPEWLKGLHVVRNPGAN